MTNWLNNLIAEYPEVKIVSGSRFAWSPSTNTVTYEPGALETNQGRLALLHELAHARLKHYRFKSDLALLQMEVSAWRQTKASSKGVPDVVVDEDYIEDCLESYRNWLYQRSTCVECGTNSFQDNHKIYRCHICGTSWKVPNSQLCRIQRRKIKPARVSTS